LVGFTGILIIPVKRSIPTPIQNIVSMYSVKLILWRAIWKLWDTDGVKLRRKPTLCSFFYVRRNPWFNVSPAIRLLGGEMCCQTYLTRRNTVQVLLV